MGEEVPLGIRLRQALGSGNLREANQCVINHMALGLDWFNNGEKLRIPTRIRVGISDTELRAGEFAQSQLRSERIGAPETQIELELVAAIHDTMTV